jgi:hypothetical protein
MCRQFWIECACFDCNPLAPALNWVFFKAISFSMSRNAAFNPCEQVYLACSHAVHAEMSTLRHLRLGSGLRLELGVPMDEGFMGLEAASRLDALLSSSPA